MKFEMPPKPNEARVPPQNWKVSKINYYKVNS